MSIFTLAKKNVGPNPLHHTLNQRWLLKVSLVALSITVSLFGYTYYQSKIKPMSGYGDDWAAIEALKERDPRALSGGDLTHFMFGDVSFETEAANLPWQLSATFDAGDGVFERFFSEAKTSGYRDDADGVGPLFNMNACEACHVADGRAAPPLKTGDVLQGLLFRVSIPGTDAVGGPKPHPIYGGQLADKAIDGHAPEIAYQLDFINIDGAFDDGESYQLQLPVYSFPEQNYGPLGKNAMISARIAPFMIGMGLIDAITDADILQGEDIDDADGDGISGKANRVWSVENQVYQVGKYGWKAETPTLAHQSMDAAINDMGITNPLFPNENCTQAQSHCNQALSGTTDAPVEMTVSKMNQVVTYLEFLSVPGRGYLDNPEVMLGEQLFKDTGCTACHTASFVTGTEQRQQRLHNQKIAPYSDFLLHDMGALLADNRPSFSATGSEWRTPPLWGIGMVETVNGHTRFMHDGRARSLQEAILWHGGEAEVTKRKFVMLAKNERSALLKFLKSL